MPETVTGRDEFEAESPSPSWPYWLSPQHLTTPVESTAQVCENPQPTLDESAAACANRATANVTARMRTRIPGKRGVMLETRGRFPRAEGMRRVPPVARGTRRGVAEMAAESESRPTPSGARAVVRGLVAPDDHIVPSEKVSKTRNDYACTIRTFETRAYSFARPVSRVFIRIPHSHTLASTRRRSVLPRRTLRARAARRPPPTRRHPPTAFRSRPPPRSPLRSPRTRRRL